MEARARSQLLSSCGWRLSPRAAWGPSRLRRQARIREMDEKRLCSRNVSYFRTLRTQLNPASFQMEKEMIYKEPKVNDIQLANSKIGHWKKESNVLNWFQKRIPYSTKWPSVRSEKRHTKFRKLLGDTSSQEGKKYGRHYILSSEGPEDTWLPSRSLPVD